jgi:hypothetical protein
MLDEILPPWVYGEETFTLGSMTPLHGVPGSRGPRHRHLDPSVPFGW